MTYKTKFKLKKIWYHILAILTILAIVIIGAIQGKFFEIVTSMLCFFIFRPLFEKQYHSRTLYKCSLVSIIVYFIMSRVILDFASSLFFTILLTFALTCASYFIRDLLDNTILLKYYKDKAENTPTKALENYTLEELKQKIPNISFDIIEIVYGYLHKPSYLNAVGYARNNHIAVSTLYKYLKIVKNELKNLE